MGRKKRITIRTQQDLEAACKRMEDHDRDTVDDFGEDVTEGEYEERAHWAQKCPGDFDDAW